MAANDDKRKVLDQINFAVEHASDVINACKRATAATGLTFVNSRVTILEARLQKVEAHLAASASLSFTGFALEVLLTVLLGPTSKILLVRPVTASAFSKVVANKQVIAGLNLKLGDVRQGQFRKHVAKLKETVDGVKHLGLGFWRDEAAIRQLESAGIKGFNAFRDAMRQKAQVLQDLTADSITEALKKLTLLRKKTFPAGAAGDAYLADESLVAKQIVDRTSAKLDQISADLTHHADLLKNAVMTDTFSAKDMGSLLELLAVGLGDFNRDTDIDTSELEAQFEALLIQQIWVILLGKGSNIATMTRGKRRLRDGRLHAEGIRDTPYEDEADVYPYAELKVSEALVHEVIVVLPSRAQSFLVQAVDDYNEHVRLANVIAQVNGGPRHELMTREKALKSPAAGAHYENQQFGISPRERLSVRDHAVSLLCRFVDDYGKALNQGANQADKLLADLLRGEASKDLKQ